MTDAAHRIREHMPSRENAAFPHAFDAIYAGAHDDITEILGLLDDYHDRAVKAESTAREALARAAALANGMPTEAQWEYGWVSRFENGEEYERWGCASRGEAEQEVTLLQKQEDAMFAKGNVPERLTYSLRRRLVPTPGPWEPVER